MRIRPQRLLLAIESSCDDTSLAFLNLAGKLIYKLQESQRNIHKPFWGVVPQLAAQGHKRSLMNFSKDQFLQRVFRLKLIDRIAVTTGPGIGACLSTGFEFGKLLSNLHQVPLIPINHLHGHLESIKYCRKNITYPHLHLLISGGNTQLILSSGPGRYTILGQTIDDAIGEAIDKIARHLSSDWSSSGGLGQPLEKLAETGQILPFKISCLDHTINPLSFSFSGYKTSLVEFIKKNYSYGIENLAATVQAVLFDHLLDRTELCFKILIQAGFNIKQMSVIGGVACNQYFRNKLSQMLHNLSVELIVPPKEICTDNAVMIGLAALSVLNHSNPSTKFKYLMNRPDQDWNIEELSISKALVE